MRDERDLTALSVALQDFQPVIQPFNGVLTLMLTISDRHTLEVSRLKGDYFILRSVFMDENGVSDNILVATVLGIALIPTMVAAYAAVHAAGKGK